MNPPRDIAKVIDAMLAVIPTGMLELRTELRAVSSKAGYVAPEIMHMVWSNGTEVIARHFPTPDKLSPWQKHAIDIWVGRTGPYAPSAYCSICGVSWGDTHLPTCRFGR